MADIDIKQNELKILDYWYINELLEQDDWYNTGRVMKDLRRKLRRKEKPEMLEMFISVREDDDDIISKISSVSASHGMSEVSRNITVYLGKVMREPCVEAIARLLDSKEERPEKSRRSIAWASFQMDRNGEYKKGSFSLSPILWAIDRLKHNGNGGIVSGVLSLDAYHNDIGMIDHGIRERTERRNDIPTLQAQAETGAEECEEDNGDARLLSDPLTGVQMWELLRWIEDRYVDGNIYGKADLRNAGHGDDEQKKMQNPCADRAEFAEDGREVLLVFREYSGAKAHLKYPDPEYTGLSRDFFIKDIMMVRSLIEQDSMGRSGMEGALHEYITEPYLDHMRKSSFKRNNIVNVPADKMGEYSAFLARALDIGAAPEAKWPSRYRPALMQQIAVNAVTSGIKDSHVFRDLTYPVFSVNGPPGTGKTTMLKEIVASNIVERAKLLVKYEDPDLAFSKHHFKKGIEGNRYYSQYHRNFYSLKDDKINDYGILVTSNNNSAVENITKELPMESKMLNDLKISDDDTEDVKNALSGIRDMFKTDGPAKVGEYYRKENIDPDKDIYFSDAATVLFNAGKEDDDEADKAWGLVAVPLGRRYNLDMFTRRALSSVLDLFRGKGRIAGYMERYKRAREDFLGQLEKVETLKERIESISGLYRKKFDMEEKFPSAEAEYLKARETYDENISSLNEKVQETVQSAGKLMEKKRELEKDIERYGEEIVRYTKDIDEYSNSIKEDHRMALEALNSVRGLRIFNRKRRLQAEALADDYNRESVQLETKKDIAEQKKQETEELKEKSESELEDITGLCRLIQKKTESIGRELSEERGKRQDLDEAFQGKKSALDEIRRQTGIISKSVRGYDARVILDEGFIRALTGDDEELSVKAHISDPWFTMEYDIEREKLFYYALELTKYFTLASICCRDNLQHLYAYWTGKYYDRDAGFVRFEKEDVCEMITPLYQTLFLLVPVVSSTFASVGSLLEYAGKGTVGLLVVDEAGQAQPQMALGALYRSRHALIVGDPRQVEPIVGDGLRLLQDAFSGELYAAYKAKNISVQKCADLLNPYGNYLEDGTDQGEWVGSPLLVHRRCISPMYDISNAISYDGLMKQQTQKPGEEKIKTFAGSSCWINVEGEENGGKDHYNPAQGEKAAEIVFKAFELAAAQNGDLPSLFIITPFRSVRDGIKLKLRHEWRQKDNRTWRRVFSGSDFEEWMEDNIGTVHKFQGKEADQVIFLLGCDASKEAKGAVNWVNSNIVNVAVTRAKYRLYIIGDIGVWKANDHIRKAKAIIDTYKLKEIESSSFISPASSEEAEEINSELPGLYSFPRSVTITEDGDKEISVDTSGFISELADEKIGAAPLTKEQAQRFGFQGLEDLRRLVPEVRENLEWGIKLFYMLEPIYQKDHQLDASCCAILFCKALELHVKACMEKGLKETFPDFQIKGQGSGRNRVKLSDAHPEEMTLGTFDHIVRNNINRLSKHMRDKDDTIHDKAWWNAYEKKLQSAIKKRNSCCHAELFEYKKVNELLADMFSRDYSDPATEMKTDGLMFSSEIGKEL